MKDDNFERIIKKIRITGISIFLAIPTLIGFLYLFTTNSPTALSNIAALFFKYINQDIP